MPLFVYRTTWPCQSDASLGNRGGCQPVAILSHPDGMSQPHCETYREREWSLLAFSVNLFFQVSEKSESGANPPADIVVVGRESGGEWRVVVHLTTRKRGFSSNQILLKLFHPSHHDFQAAGSSEL